MTPSTPRKQTAENRENYRYGQNSQQNLKTSQQIANIMQLQQVHYLPDLEIRTSDSERPR